MDIKIAISSLAFIGRPIEEMVEIAKENGFPLEFSSSLPYHPRMDEIYLSAPIVRMAHNYFPAPEVPFVMNLASAIDEVRTTSLNHCKHAIDLTATSGAPFFSAHAGYCIDPKPDQLGNPLDLNADYDKEFHWQYFIPSVRELVAYAKSKGVGFLIENNVAARFNFNHAGEHPFLCSDVKDLMRISETINDDHFGILLDTAHHKVTALAMGFDMNELDALAPFIKCIHHSDNDGTVDDNSPIDENYWFLKRMKQFREIWHVLEVKSQSPDQLKKQINLLVNSIA